MCSPSLLLLFYSILSFVDSSEVSQDQPLHYYGKVNSTSDVNLDLSILLSSDMEAVRLTTELLSPDAGMQAPVEFTVRQVSGSPWQPKHWRLPSRRLPDATRAAQTLCPPLSSSRQNASLVSRFKVIISCMSAHSVEFSVRAEVVQFGLEAGRSLEASAAPLEPQVFHLRPTEEKKEYVLRVENISQAVCGIVAIRPAESCEYGSLEQEESLVWGESTFFESFLRSATFLIGRRQLPWLGPEGVLIVVAVRSTDDSCRLLTRHESPAEERRVTVSLSVQEQPDLRLESTLAVLAFYAVSCVMAVVMSAICFRFDIELEGVRSAQSLNATPPVLCLVSSLTCSRRSAKDLPRRDPIDSTDIPQADLQLSAPNEGSITILGTQQSHQANGSMADCESTVDSVIDHLNFRRACFDEERPAVSDSREQGEKDPSVRGDLGDQIPYNSMNEQAGTVTQQGTRTIEVQTCLRACAEPQAAPTTAKAARLWYQESCDPVTCNGGPDEADGRHPRTTRHPFYDGLVRSRHCSGTESACDRPAVCIHWDRVKQRRSRLVNQEVTLADMSVLFYDRELFRPMLFLRSGSYLWLTVLMGIFYTLPVAQLVLFYQQISVRHGDLDICYYNFQCLYPWMGLEDYGHVFSNVGYGISGLCFILIVKRRSLKYRRMLAEAEKIKAAADPLHPTNCGIPEQFGLYYALGTALLLEGVLSACYHVCPTARNFQFDTTFMYAIAILVFLKVYQFRHPDISQTAHIVFLVIGLALVTQVLGYFTDHLAFWIVFVIAYILLVLVFVVHVYSFGNAPTIAGFTAELTATLRNFRPVGLKSPVACRAAIPSLVVIGMNVLLAVYFLYRQRAGVSRYLLAILMMNMLLYLFNYIGQKMRYRFRRTDWRANEGIRKTTIGYGVLSVSLMVAAIYFFTQELKSSAGTAAESRNLNAPCLVGIFDNHDMWHFLSAGSLFHGLMFILTLEDCNIRTPRNKIAVF